MNFFFYKYLSKLSIQTYVLLKLLVLIYQQEFQNQVLSMAQL